MYFCMLYGSKGYTKKTPPYVVVVRAIEHRSNKTYAVPCKNLVKVSVRELLSIPMLFPRLEQEVLCIHLMSGVSCNNCITKG
jgi:hypothetical protein